MKFEINIEKVLESVVEQLEEQGYKPAIHAKWIKVRNVFKCSNCDLIPRDANHKLVVVYPGWDYCPNCGARMDGVETKILYVCNPDKNVKCDKTSCYINGGECRLTDKEEFAKVNESGVPIQDKSQEWYEKMIKGW